MVCVKTAALVKILCFVPTHQKHIMHNTDWTEPPTPKETVAPWTERNLKESTRVPMIGWKCNVMFI